MRFPSTSIAALLALSLTCAIDAHAQARASDGDAQSRPIAASFTRLEEALTPTLVGADDAASRWLLGRLESLDPAAKTRDYAAAVAREPRQMLYVASLADACMRGTGAMVECTERDPVGYWASRDSDNAVPWLLQAERARRRNNPPSMIDNLERASKATRYDTYDHRAGAVLASKLAPVAAPEDGAAAAVFAAQTTTSSGAALDAVQTLCGPQGRALDARIAASCQRLGALMAERAGVLTDRRAGTQIALATAATDNARAEASELARNVVARQERCRVAVQSLERGALGTPEQRTRAATLGTRFVEARAKDGEAAACDALANAVGG
jgi:hypothetical protein